MEHRRGRMRRGCWPKSLRAIHLYTVWSKCHGYERSWLIGLHERAKSRSSSGHEQFEIGSHLLAFRPRARRVVQTWRFALIFQPSLSEASGDLLCSWAVLREPRTIASKTSRYDRSMPSLLPTTAASTSTFYRISPVGRRCSAQSVCSLPAYRATCACIPVAS